MTPGIAVEVAVVGRGLIGSAAARHLVDAGVETALIGPGEPPDRSNHRGPFASHHDRARVTRIAAGDRFWARVAAASIGRYEEIEARSGIGFHRPCGLLVVPDDPAVWLATSAEHGGGAQPVDVAWVRERTGIEIDADRTIVHEPGPAGLIDPLALVAAQTEIGRAGGATVIDSWVSTATRRDSGWVVSGPFGELTARRLLIATGGFGSSLLPAPPLLTRRPRTVVMARVPAEVGNRLPSLIHDGPMTRDLAGIYWTPPVTYPDGHSYLKIGGDTRPRPVVSEAALDQWFRGDGDAHEVAELQAALRRLLPGVEPSAMWSKPCVVVFTPTEYPYIGFVDDDMAVALGGNGAAAKSCDELGRLASTLFTGWDRSYDPAQFEPRLEVGPPGRFVRGQVRRTKVGRSRTDRSGLNR